MTMGEVYMSGTMSGLGFYERGQLLKKVQILDMALNKFQQGMTDPQQVGKAFAQVGLRLKTLGREDEAVMAFRQALKTGSPLHPRTRAHPVFAGRDAGSLDQDFKARGGSIAGLDENTRISRTWMLGFET